MKYLLTCLFLVFFTASLSARGDKAQITPSREIVGMSFPGDVPIYARHFVFPCKIYRAIFDTNRQEVTLLLKMPEKNTDLGMKGYLLVADLKTNSVKWSRKVNALGMAQGEDGILSWGIGPTICYDRNTGEKLWKRPATKIAYIDQAKDIAYSTDVDAIDMKTGKAKWSYEHYYGQDYWESVNSPDDSTMVISVGGGIMGVNTNTGKGWQYAASNSKANALPLAAAAIGIGMGLLTGFMVVPILVSNPKQGMRSQLLFEDHSIFLADRKRIERLSVTTGAKSWETALPNTTSKSALASNKGNIIVVNKGVAERDGGYFVLSGHPYIASFTKDSGRQNYFVDITSYGPVFREDLSNDTLSLLFARYIIKYDAATGRQLFLKNIEVPDTNTVYLYFVNASLAYLPDGASSYTHLAEKYPAAEFLNTNTDSVIIYNKQFEAPKYVRKSEMVFEYDSIAGYHLLGDHKSMLLTKNNKKQAAIALPGYANGDSKRICFIPDNSLYVVELDSLIKR